jgi:hypothetical protein
MMRARDLLERFRPSGAPGAAAPAGVPSERAAILREELLPVLELLGPTETQCDAVLRESRVRAERLRGDAATRSAARLSEARAQAEAARAEAAARQRRRSDAIRADLTPATGEPASPSLPGAVRAEPRTDRWPRQ